ncbi:MAG: hypothetical protein PHQ43_06025 [Dehalococcoidales bacterium]|nr:hypothetical protein [Dehalococcoidales bacterium]
MCTGVGLLVHESLFCSLRKRSAGVDPRTWVYLAAGTVYLFGVWAHIPYGGGHLYSDIVSVFQNRFSQDGAYTTAFPYIDVFVEYPVLTGIFIYLMGMLGRCAPFSAAYGLLSNYYLWTALFLLIPTFLSIRELFKIADILGMGSIRKRMLLYFVVTPSLAFMVLTNWYIIGVFFMLLGLRKFLQGSRWVSGALLGFSAAANLMTAAPALGMVLAARDKRDAARFILGALAALCVIYVPVYVLNPEFISEFVAYHGGWYAEGSWMLAFMNSFNPLRRILFPVVFALLSIAIAIKGLRLRKVPANNAASSHELAVHVVLLASLFSFAWLFSAYVSTPQTNLMLLPFFVLLPMSKRYAEFLTFDLATSLILVWGFSQPLSMLGITLHPLAMGSPYESPIQALGIIRSLWIGKFLICDGLLFSKQATNQFRSSGRSEMVQKALTRSDNVRRGP